MGDEYSKKETLEYKEAIFKAIRNSENGGVYLIIHCDNNPRFYYIRPDSSLSDDEEPVKKISQLELKQVYGIFSKELDDVKLRKFIIEKLLFV